MEGAGVEFGGYVPRARRPSGPSFLREDGTAQQAYPLAEVRGSGNYQCSATQEATILSAVQIIEDNLDSIPDTAGWGLFNWLPSNMPRSPRQLVAWVLGDTFSPHLRINCSPSIAPSNAPFPLSPFVGNPLALLGLSTPGRICADYPTYGTNAISWSYPQYLERFIDIYFCPSLWTSSLFTDNGAAYISCVILHELFHGLGILDEPPIGVIVGSSFCAIVENEAGAPCFDSDGRVISCSATAQSSIVHSPNDGGLGRLPGGTIIETVPPTGKKLRPAPGSEKGAQPTARKTRWRRT